MAASRRDTFTTSMMLPEKTGCSGCPRTFRERNSRWGIAWVKAEISKAEMLKLEIKPEFAFGIPEIMGGGVKRVKK